MSGKRVVSHAAQVFEHEPIPPRAAREPPSTPPRLPRQLFSFLHPDVKFFHFIAGEPIDVGEERIIMAMRCALAVNSDTRPQCVELYDMANHEKIKDTEDCLVANVGVYLDTPAADMRLQAFALDIAQ